MKRIKYLSTSTVQSLRENISSNVKLYQSGDFSELMNYGEWSVELQASADLSPLAELDPSGKSEAEIENSMRVWKALGKLTPSLAYEEGIWARLTHVECLEYSRKRWLSDPSNDDAVTRDVKIHFFADTRGQRRDDNAISRLWWNAYVAHNFSPSNPRSALQLILSRADTRLSLIERSLTGTRTPIVRGMLRVVSKNPSINSTEKSFRQFMMVLNRKGGGQVFESMSDEEVEGFLLSCATQAGVLEPNIQAA